MRSYTPCVPVASRTPANQQLASGVGVSTPCGAVSTPPTTVFAPGLLELYRYRRISDPEMGPCPPRVALALRIPSWDFQTMRGGIDPGDHLFRSHFSKIIHIDGFLIRGWDLILPRWRWLLKISGWGFHTVRGGINPTILIPSMLALQMHGRTSDPGIGPPTRAALASRTSGWSFHTDGR